MFDVSYLKEMLKIIYNRVTNQIAFYAQFLFLNEILILGLTSPLLTLSQLTVRTILETREALLTIKNFMILSIIVGKLNFKCFIKISNQLELQILFPNDKQ